MVVTDRTVRESNEKSDREWDAFRVFHDGPLRRCPACGRKVFLPCLACETERCGKVADPQDATEEELLRIELEGDRRRRYEYCRLKKVAEAIRKERDEP